MATMTVCNRCGRDISENEVPWKFSIERRIGFGSKYDRSYLDFDLCNKCFDELVEDAVNSWLYTPVAEDWEQLGTVRKMKRRHKHDKEEEEDEEDGVEEGDDSGSEPDDGEGESIG